MLEPFLVRVGSALTRAPFKKGVYRHGPNGKKGGGFLGARDWATSGRGFPGERHGGLYRGPETQIERDVTLVQGHRGLFIRELAEFFIPGV